VLLKPNQRGTLSETLQCWQAARERGYAGIVSARSGESEDTTIVHLAIGWQVGQLKVGSFARSERMAKWNEALRIEERLGARARFAGARVFGPYPTSPARAHRLDLRLHDAAANRVLDGVLMGMHTGLEDGRKHFAALAAFFAERARGGVGLMVTGGFAPNIEGWAKPFAGTLATSGCRAAPPAVTDAVHAEGGRIALQILHTGRYGYQPLCVAPSRSRARSRRSRRANCRCAASSGRSAPSCAARRLARDAGYDGVEVMGSEGYFINQFLVTHTNHRTDAWGGDYANRMRLPVEIVSARARGGGAGLHHHLPPVDARPDPRRQLMARGGAARQGRRGGRCDDHQHRHRLARGTRADDRHQRAARRLRLGDEEDARGAARRRHRHPAGDQQPHQHARGGRAAAGRRQCRHGQPGAPAAGRPRLRAPRPPPARRREINTCIACNQACLDHTFANRLASCLVNPRAGHETTLRIAPAAARKRVAVVGAGPAGLAAATTLAERGHEVTCSRPRPHRRPVQHGAAHPGKEEFGETLRYFEQRLVRTGVHLHLNHASMRRLAARATTR
jgi:2,4-dienoyl-CoA reductase (NADPH2)